MSFLQPWLLLGLPLIALPIVIHLVNQRRYQTMPWGAMHFLLAANRMSRGFAKLRQWLILAMRVLAILTLVLTLSRPLASGWLGLVGGGHVDTTLILLDRSPSMGGRGTAHAQSKLETAKRQIVQTLQTLPRSRYVLCDSVRREPIELADLQALSESPQAGPLSSSCDLPALLQMAHEYIVANQSARTDVWICSDLQRNDWDPESGRWSVLRDAFLELPPGTRFHLLAYAEQADHDAAVRATRVVRQDTEAGGELLISLVIERHAAPGEKGSIPVQFDLEGARSSLTVEIEGPRVEIQDHRIPLDQNKATGWGRISLPADSNLTNNEFFFTYSLPTPPHTVVVADEPPAAEVLQLAVAIPPDPRVKPRVEVINATQLATTAWEDVGLLLWQSALPEGKAADIIKSFVEGGGVVVFFPPRQPTTATFRGLQWQDWQAPPKPLSVDTWRGDADLLANTQSGAGLPLGTLEVDRYCTLQGEFTELARLTDRHPLVVRVPTPRGGVYAITTTPHPQDSSLARDGVVFYVALQRALQEGTVRLAAARQIDAGSTSMGNQEAWQRLGGSEEALSHQYSHHAGVYAHQEQLLAVNRSGGEDTPDVVTDEQLAGLFRGLDLVRIDDRAGTAASLIQEIWRIFLLTMLAAMLVEAMLCLPRPARVERQPA